jgi:hypothetical protein
MAISSISSGSVPDIQSLTPSVAPSPSGIAAPAASGVTIDISKPGQLFGQLSSLADTDPAKFKAVAADIAQKLKDAAGAQSDGRADFLSKLADRFTSAAQSGNASDLAPATGKAHGGHHHGGGHLRTKAVGGPDQAGATGQGAGDNLAQEIQGIISGALDAVAT